MRNATNPEQQHSFIVVFDFYLFSFDFGGAVMASHCLGESKRVLAPKSACVLACKSYLSVPPLGCDRERIIIV